MTSFEVLILTPEKEVYKGNALKITVRTTEGDVGIFANHINYVAPLGIGKLTLTTEEEVRVAATTSGFIAVESGKVTILTDFFEWKDEIDVARAENDKIEAEQALKSELDEVSGIHMEIKLKKAINRINISKLR